MKMLYSSGLATSKAIDVFKLPVSLQGVDADGQSRVGYLSSSGLVDGVLRFAEGDDDTISLDKMLENLGQVGRKLAISSDVVGSWDDASGFGFGIANGNPPVFQISLLTRMSVDQVLESAPPIAQNAKPKSTSSLKTSTANGFPAP